MDDFATAPGKPNMYGLVQGEINAVAPGKRMLSAMTPTIVVDPQGRLFLVAGAPGGPRIITAVYHAISNVIDHHMSLAQAIEAPRLHHQALPDTIMLERGGFTPAVIDSLRAMGHAVRGVGLPRARDGDRARAHRMDRRGGPALGRIGSGLLARLHGQRDSPATH